MNDELDFNDLDGGFDDEQDDGYDFDNWDTVELGEAGNQILGEIEAVLEDVGKYDSRAYLLKTADGQALVWGNASINAGFDNSEASEGDMLGIRNTGETYENDYGEFAQYEVRYKAADDE